jgi:hypothetical protein
MATTTFDDRSTAATKQSDGLVIFASSLGTVFEWYDFYIYGTLGAILAGKFFSGVAPTSAFIFTLLAFAAASRWVSYAFVTGFNRFIQGNTQHDPDFGFGPPAGGNVGIIKDPFGAQPKLVAGTRMIPFGYPDNVVVSADGKLLTAAYPGVNGVFVFDVDLVHTVKAELRPADEPLLLMLAEPRRLRMRLSDGLYVRLVDVPAALAARGYAEECSIVIEVEDTFCDWNDGRYELAVTAGGVTCETTEAEPDLSCSAEDLGALYLGGTTWRQLHRAGRVSECTAGSLARADRSFASDPAPWCSFFF